MLPDRVSNPGPLTYESGTLPIALRGPATLLDVMQKQWTIRLTITRSHACNVTRNWVCIGRVMKQLFHAFYERKSNQTSFRSVTDPLHYRSRPGGL